MTKFFLIAIIILILVCAVFFLLWRLSVKGKKAVQEKLSATQKALNEAIIHQAELESTINILNSNRKEADEKVNNLHSGDSVGNALNELRKRKN